jgi:hypothetical protein
MSYGQPPPAIPLSSPTPSSAPSLSPAAGAVRLPLSPVEIVLRNHAILCSIAWLILLPLGAVLARYLRTFTPLVRALLAFARAAAALTRTHSWFWIHAVIQLVFSAPIFYAGWQRGAKIARFEFADTHQVRASAPPRRPLTLTPPQRVGLAMLILYTLQLVLGLFIHFVKLPVRWPGGRSPQNYLHVAIGIALLALGSFNVHQGIYYEWPRATGNRHPIPQSAKNAWLALVIVRRRRAPRPLLHVADARFCPQVFWGLYGLGFGFLPRQFKQEKASRQLVHKELGVSSA